MSAPYPGSMGSASEYSVQRAGHVPAPAPLGGGGGSGECAANTHLVTLIANPDGWGGHGVENGAWAPASLWGPGVTVEEGSGCQVCCAALFGLLTWGNLLCALQTSLTPPKAQCLMPAMLDGLVVKKLSLHTKVCTLACLPEHFDCFSQRVQNGENGTCFQLQYVCLCRAMPPTEPCLTQNDNSST